MNIFLPKKEGSSLKELISKEIFEELAQTGRIGYSPEEAEMLRREMNRQMDVIRQLESIPLDEELPPVIHGNPYAPEIRCELRDDAWKPFDDPERIISQAPVHRDGYIVSPDVIHQKIS